MKIENDRTWAPRLVFVFFLLLMFFATICANADSWVTNSSMLMARLEHTATLLPNGQVLVTGGYNSHNGSLTNVDIYDPSTQTWSLNAGMQTARYRHTATLLTNGQVLVAGGISGGSSCELFDPASGTWTNTGSLNVGRYDHIATLLKNGQVLVAGGSDNNAFTITNAEIYDPNTRVWTAVNGMSVPRSLPSATLLPNGMVLVAGGGAASISAIYYSSAEIYDPSPGRWIGTRSMATPRVRHSATLLLNGKVLVAGGQNGARPPAHPTLSSAELYDPATGKWTPASDMNFPRSWFTATLLPSGRVLAAGGQDFGYYNNAEVYDPMADAWTLTSNSMNRAHADHVATRLSNGTILVTGGYNATNGYLINTELYYPDPAIASTIFVKGAAMSSGGPFQLTFTNTPGATFSVSVTTNLSFALSNWTILNGVLEISPGQFQFTDLSATNGGQSFYCVHSP